MLHILGALLFVPVARGEQADMHVKAREASRDGQSVGFAAQEDDGRMGFESCCGFGDEIHVATTS